MLRKENAYVYNQFYDWYDFEVELTKSKFKNTSIKLDRRYLEKLKATTAFESLDILVAKSIILPGLMNYSNNNSFRAKVDEQISTLKLNKSINEILVMLWNLAKDNLIEAEELIAYLPFIIAVDALTK